MTIPDIERIKFFPGQRLSADDLNAEQDLAREMRWLHNRTLHDWGIVTGLAVGGRAGDRSVSVDPGMAIDSSGREILLTEAMVKGIPVVSGEAAYYLIARYQGDSSQPVLEERDGVCAPGGAVRFGNDPLIEWRLHKDLREGRDIVLGMIQIKNCKLSRNVSTSVRRLAKPPGSPHIVSGETKPANTNWQAWAVQQQIIGFTVRVDTSPAQFEAAPEYFAHIAGDLLYSPQPGPLLAVPVTSVSHPTREGFTLRVLLPTAAGAVPVNPGYIHHAQHGPAVFASLGWHVVWAGIEK